MNPGVSRQLGSWLLLTTALALVAPLGCKKDERAPPKRDPDAPSAVPAPIAAKDTTTAEAATEPAPAPRWPGSAAPPNPELRGLSVEGQQAYLLELLTREEGLDEQASSRIADILHASSWLGFGNPKVARPAMTQAECRERWSDRAWPAGDPECGHRNMRRIAPGLCIDQYEFPNLLCEYPVVWVRSSEAAELCGALGKRLCDAHEWEGACAGEVRDPAEEYLYDRLPKGQGAEYRRARRMLMESWHNAARDVVWAYGPEKDLPRCGTGARKSATCTTVDWGICGTNDYPAGSFPDCASPLGIFDQHGNVAEHMSLPLLVEELGGGGYTEMKGSWFLFGREETHPDDCRWRARNWHTTRISDPNSHRNYHLGFRCCADVASVEPNSAGWTESPQ